MPEKDGAGALGDHGSSASSSASTAEDSSAISALPALLPQAKEPRLPEPGSRDAEQVGSMKYSTIGQAEQ